MDSKTQERAKERLAQLEAMGQKEYWRQGRFGTYNVAPEGWREVTEAEFGRTRFFDYEPICREHRQLLRDQDGEPLDYRDLPNARVPRMIDAPLFWFSDETGVAIWFDSAAQRVRYFAFGCRHDFVELGGKECWQRGVSHFGMCYHVYECSKCGHIEAHDSSD